MAHVFQMGVGATVSIPLIRKTYPTNVIFSLVYASGKILDQFLIFSHHNTTGEFFRGMI